MEPSSLMRSCLVMACLVSVAAQANIGGISGRSGKQGISCMSGCHNITPAPNAPTVLLTGPARLNIGETGDYAIIIRGGTAQEAGMNVAVSDKGGTLAPADRDTQLLDGELTHRNAETVPPSGERSFPFKLTAPGTPGTVTLYGAGLSVNDDSTERGDRSANHTLQIQVIDPAAPPPGKDEDTGCAAAGGLPLPLLLLLLARPFRRVTRRSQGQREEDCTATG